MSEIILDAYAARSCPVKVQNAYRPGVLETERKLDGALEELFAGGRAFQDRVLDAIVAGFTGSVHDLRTLSDQPSAVREAATLAAFAAGVDLVVGGLIPRDPVGHRSGNADLWVRGPNSQDGRAGYYPVEAKWHRVLERATGTTDGEPLRVSRLAAPQLQAAIELPEQRFRFASREGDLLQLSHYWRHLEALGHAAAGEPWAGIIGTDPLPSLGEEVVVSWIRLDDKRIRTYARSSQSAVKRSALERYDHEHQFRVKVAQAAQEAESGGRLMVSPIRIKECDSCVWWEACRGDMPEDDLSVRIGKSPLDAREIAVLRTFGISSVDQLADADLDELLPAYLPLVGHRSSAEERLRLAARRAAMLRDGHELERISHEPADLPPVARIEVDFDVETAPMGSGSDGGGQADEGRVYLWGFLVHDTTSDEPPQYVEFSAFERLDKAGELELARAAMAWLLDLAHTHGDGLRVYHYSDYEVVRLARIAEASQDPTLRAALDLAREQFCDLFAVMRRQYFGAKGLGLKQVVAFVSDFTWRDESPGGLNSQTWFRDAVSAPTAEEREAARRRVLDYNEDDVRATHVLRDWLRRQG